MSTITGSSRPVPRPLQLPSNSSSPRSSPVMVKSPLSASVRYSNNSWREIGKDSPFNSPQMGSKRQNSLLYNTSSPSPQLPQHHVRRNTVASGSNGINAVLSSSKSPTNQTQVGSPQLRSSLQSVKEAEPATLAEKHADLLRFIAQKESKCLELRTQLAQHEAELLLLKQKWERIVSKGSPALPGTEPAPSRSTGDVLGGIREGVQNGFEKVLAVLEPAIASSSDSSSTSSSGSPVSTTTSIPLPSQASSAFTSASKHSKNTGSLSLSTSTHGRSSISSSVSSLFDHDTQSNGAQSLDSPILEDGGHGVQKLKSLPSTNASTRSSSPLTIAAAAPPSNARHAIRSTSLSSTLSQFSSSLSSPDNIGKSVASWVSPSLNKKWEELRNNEAISKQSKRASVLFNDMLSVLSTSNSSSTTSASPSTAIPSTGRSPISPLVLDPVADTFIASSASLLDDGPENELGVVLRPDYVLLPTKTNTTNTVPNNPTIEKVPQEVDADDDEKWNW